MMNGLKEFLANSLTAYQACDNAKTLLLANGFTQLSETETWQLQENGKYFVSRGGSSVIAFTVGANAKTDADLTYKIVASHTDSPALKLKENPCVKGAYVTLNVEKYGGGLWYTFFDRPLKIAGRVILRENNRLFIKSYQSDFYVTIPSQAIHINREANEKFAVNAQVDLLPLFALNSENLSFDEMFAGLKTSEDCQVVSYDLFLVNADMPYTFGLKNEFLASPRVDNLSSVYSSMEGLLAAKNTRGICVAAMLDNEEVGSLTAQGADGDFMENVLRRIAYALGKDDEGYYQAVAKSFLLSADNAHALHPNHPEKSDPTNKTLMGGGVVIKAHASKAYVTDGLSAAILKTVFDKANVKHQAFFNRSDVRSGSTLGAASLRHVGMRGADVGLAQLAMHSACECFAIADYAEMVKGITAFYDSAITETESEIVVE